MSLHGGVHAPQVFWQFSKTSVSLQWCFFVLQLHFFQMLTHLVRVRVMVRVRARFRVTE